jgi:putative acetyltransferase
MIEIREAAIENDYDAVRILAYALLNWLREIYPEAQNLFEQDLKTVEADVASFIDAGGSSARRLLVAEYDGQVAGMVALQDKGERTCEMKQMFVDPMFRGKGIGRALATTLLSDAQALGYLRMRLSTGKRQVAAQELYRSLGFQITPPYQTLPENLRSLFLFMYLSFKQSIPLDTE